MLVVYLIVHSGAGEVASAMLVIGWWLLPITLYHLVPLFLSALSWRDLLPLSSRPDVFSVTWMRWIRESINALLPVASVGGDIASARLAHLRGVPSTQAAASMVVDTTVGVITQMVFVIAGVILLVARPAQHAASNVVVWIVLIGIAVFFVAVAAFVFFQHKNMFARFAGLARFILPEKWLSHFLGSASAMDDAVVRAYRSGDAFWRANFWRVAGWAAGTGEVWLVAQCVDHPMSMIDAFILESLSSGARAAGFVVPGALGVLEGGMVLFGAVLGLPAEIALAISLTKRVRELALGLPGLFAWYWIEGHYLLLRKEDEKR